MTTRQRRYIALVFALALAFALLPAVVSGPSAQATQHAWIGSAAGAHRAFDPGPTYGRPLGSDLWESGFPKGFQEGDTVPIKMEDITGSVGDQYKFNICLDETDNRAGGEVAFIDLASYDTSYSPSLASAEPPDPANLTGDVGGVNAEGAVIDSVTYLGVAGVDLTTQAAFCPVGYNVWQVELTMTATSATAVWGGVLSKPGDTTVSGLAVVDGKSASDISGTFQARIGAEGAGDQSINFAGRDIEPLPELSITKTADPTEVPETGGVVTFTITVSNTGTADASLTSLTDSIYGDPTVLDDGLAVQLTTCAFTSPETVLAGGSYVCEFTAIVSGDFGGPDHTNTATASDGTTEYSDDATVTFTDVLPDVSITKTADPTEVPETGGDVEFTIVVTNNSLEDATIDSLTDSDFNLAAHCPDAVGTVLGHTETYTCTFTETVSGDFGGPDHENTATVVASDGDGNTDTESATETVGFTDVPAFLDATKTADPMSVPSGGGDVTYTVTITSRATNVDIIWVDTITDDGGTGTQASIFDIPGAACTGPDGAVTQADLDTPLGVELEPGESIVCTYTVTFAPLVDVIGDPPDPANVSVINVAQASGVDDDGVPVSGEDEETVRYFWNGCTPGFWKNHAGKGPQANVWPLPYSPDDLLSSVFTIPGDLGTSAKGGSGKRSTGIAPDDTLWDAVNYMGGNERRGAANILLRAAVAALLNEAHYGDTYPAYDTVSDLIDAVNAALAGSERSDMLALATTLDFWNNGECDLP